MSKIKDYLTNLPSDTRELFNPVFGGVDRFYTVVYLIALNEHTTDLEKPDLYEQRLDTIRYVRRQVEKLVTSYGLNGADVVADIAGDYFEDYVNYREPETEMSGDEFIEIIKAISAG